MKTGSFAKWLSLAMVLIIALGIAVPASSVAADSIGTAEKTRVWVQFDPGTKGQVMAAVQSEKAEIHYEFDDLNAIVISVPEQAIKGLANNPNIIAIEEDAPRYLYGQSTPYGIDMVQAPQVWAAGTTGTGTKVCVIDSGLYTGHEDFAGVNITGGYPSNWNTDTCGHGTHVVGTIAAANNALGVVGVAPSTSLYIVKVFGDNCAWTYSSSLVDAANRCYAAGAKIISMSLGGSTSSNTEKTAFANLYANGVLSIAAAGNEGTSAVSYPAGYDSVMSVAAVDSSGAKADFSQYNSDVEVAAPGVSVQSTVPYIAHETIAAGGLTVNGKAVEYAAEGTVTGTLVSGGICDAPSSAYSGKIVLCQRGDISFLDKVMNVQDSGGQGVVIYNNTTGDLAATLGEGYSSDIPAIGITQADGEALLAKVGQSSTLTSFVDWGVSGYDFYDGTSMATPHVSGAAALIWSANTSWTNAQIRTALTSTALDLGSAGRDVNFGYGLIQAKAALDSLQSAPSASLGVTVTTNKASYVNRETVTITVTVKNQNGVAVSGAAVSTKLTTANGKVITFAGTTNTSGVVTHTHKVSTSKYGKGTYSITSTASKTGYTSGTGSKTFIVQ